MGGKGGRMGRDFDVNGEEARRSTRTVGVGSIDGWESVLWMD